MRLRSDARVWAATESRSSSGRTTRTRSRTRRKWESPSRVPSIRASRTRGAIGPLPGGGDGAPHPAAAVDTTLDGRGRCAQDRDRNGKVGPGADVGRREPARLGRGGHPVEKDARDDDPAHRPRGRRAGTAASEADRSRQGARREDEGRSPPRGPTGIGTGTSLSRRGQNRYASRFQPPRTRRTTATRPPATAGLTRSWSQQKPQNESTRARRQARSERQAESPARARGANASTRHDGVEPATNEETREASEGRGRWPEVRNAKRGSKSLRVAISRRVRTDENMTKRDGHEPRSDTPAPGPTGTAG